MKTTIITGANGFVGSHLLDFLLEQGKEDFLVGLIRSHRSNMDNIAHLKGNPRVEIVECDLADAGSVTKALKCFQLSRIYHLAGQSNVPTSWQEPIATINSNIIGVVNLFEAVRALPYIPRIFVCGSAEEYGNFDPGRGLREDDPTNPNNIYGVTKLAQEKMALVYFYSFGLPVICARPFAHEGPRRGEKFFSGFMANHIARIEAGLDEPIIYHGDLTVKRDYMHVRDMVRAYSYAINCEPGEVYNIGAGRMITTKELLDLFLTYSTAQDRIRLKFEPKFVRPTEARNLYSDSTKFREATGFLPRVSIAQMVIDMLNFWRKKYGLPAVESVVEE